MKNRKAILSLVAFIVIASTVVSLAGLLSSSPSDLTHFTSIYGDEVSLYGKGIYQKDSISVAAQGLASDLVTLVIAVPLLIGSAYFALRGSFRGQLFLTGTLAYFLYTYVSYTFLWMYNSLFLIYVMLMTASFYAFVMMMLSFDLKDIPNHYSKQVPVRFLSGFQFFIAFAIGMLWLGKIGTSLTSGAAPAGLEHYTTLVIQGMDLGFIVPTAVFSGISLLKRKPLGYLLSSVIIIKAITMLTAISAMILNSIRQGISVSLVEGALFPIFNLIAIYAFYLLMHHIKSPHMDSVETR
ncbi:hypothetical protein QE109_11405 [Fusibacter bizertensis]|uniref:Uncharacterized protein n=1 Tax=Fusibacter bizertensis TaxID=1488331 RepID=A0ABT6NEA9_9FIRM|nr:hypothetical protein [Fusibacter bizertensis]MDH8678759.1 hypothetical protein [Fusibacter bizertensis]